MRLNKNDVYFFLKHKYSGLVWDDITAEDEEDKKDFINFVKRKRKNMHWNTQLPAIGSGARAAMSTYADKPTNDLNSVLEDDGQYVYCLCLSDIKLNILYEPYNLRIVSVSEIKNAAVYFTVTATNVARVSF
jgi:hypothetical protein